MVEREEVEDFVGEEGEVPAKGARHQDWDGGDGVGALE